MKLTKEEIESKISDKTLKEYECMCCKTTFFATKESNYCSGSCKQLAYLARLKEVNQVVPEVSEEEAEAEKKIKQKFNLK